MTIDRRASKLVSGAGQSFESNDEELDMPWLDSTSQTTNAPARDLVHPALAEDGGARHTELVDREQQDAAALDLWDELGDFA